ncbi:MAG: transposase [Candidatus Cloacimonetes bacterium]|nr:transposase [Candidatus Cloacimonadota bacterium]
MPSVRIKKAFNKGMYFLTFSIKRLYYIFDRHNRWDILLDSLKYCQKYKGLKIYNYVFMLNHIHLIVKNNDVSGFVRDFKRFTSKELKKNILDTEPKILKLFIENGEYNFWQAKNMPEHIFSEKFYITKANYIEQNPVRKGYVYQPEHWVYSSANKENPLLKLDSVYE